MLATIPTGRPSTRASAVTMPEAEARPQLEHRARRRPGPSIDRAHVVDPAAGSRGSTCAQQALVGARPTSSTRPWKYDRYCLATRDRLGLVGHDDVDDAVGDLHVDRADRLGREHAEPAALDHGRAAHADVRALGGDDDVAAAEEGGVAGEAAAAW